MSRKDASEIIMLNRRVQWTEAGIRISPDPRHVKDIIEELGLEGAKPADTPLIVSQSSKKDSDSRALSMRDATLYRGLVAKLNCFAMDRPDIRYAASTMGCQASSPKDADMVRLKKSGAISDWATNHLDALSMGGAIRQNHGIHGQ